MIASLQDEVKRIIGEEIKIGDMTFRLQGLRMAETNVPGSFEEFMLGSGTPIIVRIPRHRLEEYAITPTRDYDYIYWRKEHTLTPFIKQLEENLLKKYDEYSGTETDGTPIFEKVRFMKQVAVPLRIGVTETTVIGTLWEFYLRAFDDRKREMLQFGLDAGFGEMNSLGFGFMNLRTGSPEVALN